MKLFRASQSSVVHIEAVLTSNQSPVWPAKIFQRSIDTVVCKRCLSQSFIHQSTSCAKKIIQKQFFAQIFQLFPVEPHCRMLQHKFYLPVSNKEGKKLLCKQCLYIFVVLFCVTAVVSMPRLANFSPCDPLIFCFSLTIYTLSLLKNEFFLMFMGNYWERNRERESSG